MTTLTSCIERPTAVAPGRATAHKEPVLITNKYRSLAGEVLCGAGVCLPPAPPFMIIKREIS